MSSINLIQRHNAPSSKTAKGSTIRFGTPAEGDTILEFESSINSHAHRESGDPTVISSFPSDKRKTKSNRSQGKLSTSYFSKPTEKTSVSLKCRRDLSSSEGATRVDMKQRTIMNMPLDQPRDPKDLVLPKRLRSAHHTKSSNLPATDKVTKAPSSDNLSIVKPPFPMSVDPSLLHHFAIQNEPEFVSATEALYGPLPHPNRPYVPSSDPTTDVVSMNLEPLPKVPGSKIQSVMSLLRKGTSQRAFQDMLFWPNVASMTSSTIVTVTESNPASSIFSIPVTDPINIIELITSSKGVAPDMIAYGRLVTGVVPNSFLAP